MGNIRQTKRLLRGSLKEFPITMQSGILGFLSIRHNGKSGKPSGKDKFAAFAEIWPNVWEKEFL